MTAVYEESRKESYGRDGLSITRTLRVEPYADRGIVTDLLLGGILLVGGRLVRQLPARDPWCPWTICTNVECEHVEVLNSPGSNAGLSILSTRNYSESARLVATYKTPDNKANADPKNEGPATNEQQEIDLADEDWDFGAQQLTLPNAWWKWTGATELLVKENVAVAKTIPKTEYTLVRHFCARIPSSAINYLLGRVNKNPFKTPNFLWPKECLRFDGAKVSRKTTNRGVQFYVMTYKFACMTIYDWIEDDTEDFVGWNRLYRPKNTRWERPVSAGTGAHPDTIYKLDENAPSQMIGGREVKGFLMLFHPAAQ